MDVDDEDEERKRRRYMHSELSECSDTELWRSIHHLENGPLVENSATTSVDISMDDQLAEPNEVRSGALANARHRREQGEIPSDQEAMWHWDDEIDRLTMM